MAHDDHDGCGGLYVLDGHGNPVPASSRAAALLAHARTCGLALARRAAAAPAPSTGPGEC